MLLGWFLKWSQKIALLGWLGEVETQKHNVKFRKLHLIKIVEKHFLIYFSELKYEIRH